MPSSVLRFSYPSLIYGTCFNPNLSSILPSRRRRCRCRNIFSVQQSLTNITLSREADLDHAKQFYELLYLSPDVSAPALSPPLCRPRSVAPALSPHFRADHPLLPPLCRPTSGLTTLCRPPLCRPHFTADHPLSHPLHSRPPSVAPRSVAPTSQPTTLCHPHFTADHPLSSPLCHPHFTSDHPLSSPLCHPHFTSDHPLSPPLCHPHFTADHPLSPPLCHPHFTPSVAPASKPRLIKHRELAA